MYRMIHTSPTILQRHSAEVQALLEKAELARERALQAQSSDEKQFWLEMEEKWLALVRSTQHIERTYAFLDSRD
jgi:hypothetical protein